MWEMSLTSCCVISCLWAWKIWFWERYQRAVSKSGLGYLKGERGAFGFLWFTELPFIGWVFPLEGMLSCFGQLKVWEQPCGGQRKGRDNLWGLLIYRCLWFCIRTLNEEHHPPKCFSASVFPVTSGFVGADIRRGNQPPSGEHLVFHKRE